MTEEQQTRNRNGRPFHSRWDGCHKKHNRYLVLAWMPDVEKREPLRTASGNMTWGGHSEETIRQFLNKIRRGIPIGSGKSVSGYKHKRTKSRGLNREQHDLHWSSLMDARISECDNTDPMGRGSIRS